jgi:hypothetical protein
MVMHASLIAAPTTIKNKDHKRDPEMLSIKKRGADVFCSDGSHRSWY